MQHLFFTLMFSVAGVCLISALDSTMIFFLPLAVDFGLIFITSRNPSLFWLYPILLAACSLAGAAATFYLGHTIGEAGLEHFISSRRLERVKTRLKGNRAVAIAALDLLPPPFPFTAFILAAGAFKVNVRRFFIAMFAFRLVRFGAEAALAAVYGRQLVRWMESDWFRYIAYFFTAIVLVGSVFTVIQFVRKTRGRRSPSQTRRAA
jgi:membrane protein YqaA with SNARE-associated domain